MTNKDRQTDSGYALSEEQKKRYRVGNMLIWGSLIAVLLITINQTVFSNKGIEESVVRQEDIYCISAMCLIDGSVSKCTELNPTISHLVISEDPKVKGAHRLILNPTSKLCGTNIYLNMRMTEDDSQTELPPVESP